MSVTAFTLRDLFPTHTLACLKMEEPAAFVETAAFAQNCQGFNPTTEAYQKSLYPLIQKIHVSFDPNIYTPPEGPDSPERDIMKSQAIVRSAKEQLEFLTQQFANLETLRISWPTGVEKRPERTRKGFSLICNIAQLKSPDVDNSSAVHYLSTDKKGVLPIFDGVCYTGPWWRWMSF